MPWLLRVNLKVVVISTMRAMIVESEFERGSYFYTCHDSGE